MLEQTLLESSRPLECVFGKLIGNPSGFVPCPHSILHIITVCKGTCELTTRPCTTFQLQSIGINPLCHETTHSLSSYGRLRASNETPTLHIHICGLRQAPCGRGTFQSMLASENRRFCSLNSLMMNHLMTVTKASVHT